MFAIVLYGTKHSSTCHQGKAAVAAAAADAAQHCEQQIKELSAAKASLTQQVEQGQQAFQAQEEATASLTRDLEAQQVRSKRLDPLLSVVVLLLSLTLCMACLDRSPAAVCMWSAVDAMTVNANKVAC